MTNPTNPPQQISIQQQHLEHHRGPIPSPAVMNEYRDVDPSFPERIMAMAEKEQSERHRNNALMISNQFKLEWSALAGSIVVGLGGISAATAMAVFGESVGSAAFVALSSIVTPVATAIWRLRNKPKE